MEEACFAAEKNVARRSAVVKYCTHRFRVVRELFRFESSRTFRRRRRRAKQAFQLPEPMTGFAPAWTYSVSANNSASDPVCAIPFMVKRAG